MTLTPYSVEKALAFTIKAFEKVKPTSAKKRETLAYAFEQIEPLLMRYMKENNIPLLKVDLKTKRALVVEPVPNAIKQAWVEQWLSGELSTEQFKEWLRCRYQNAFYFNFADFLKDVEFWLFKKGERVSHG